MTIIVDILWIMAWIAWIWAWIAVPAYLYLYLEEKNNTYLILSVIWTMIWISGLIMIGRL